MTKRVAASATTRKRIEEWVNGRSETSGSRSEPVKLTAQLIIEEALEGEVSEELGRAYYAHGAGDGSRNGYRPGKLETAEGRVEYAVPQVCGLAGWKARFARRSRDGRKSWNGSRSRCGYAA